MRPAAPCSANDIGQRGWNIFADDLPFPIAVLKRRALEHNMAWMQDYTERKGVLLAPHGKTTMAPALLGEHFERLQRAAEENTTTAKANAWLQAFHRDMQGVLLAELDVRFLPIEGLLAALRTHPQGRHVQTSA